jgi:hypothetical protein
VLASCPGRAVGSAKLIVCALRSLLGWLHLTGTVEVSLAAAVPSVAGWRLSGLPKDLEPGQLRRLLAGCDRRTPSGRRDFAILLRLAAPDLTSRSRIVASEPRVARTAPPRRSGTRARSTI